MTQAACRRLAAKRIFALVVLVALVAAAAYVKMPRHRGVVSREMLAAEVAALPGVGEALSFEFDGLDYNGQGAAKVVAIDFSLAPGAERERLYDTMRAAGGIARESVDVYQKIVVTGWRSREEYLAGLPFASRALWLAPELVAPLDGWTLVRLPESPRAPADALSGIYARPAIVATAKGAIVADGGPPGGAPGAAFVGRRGVAVAAVRQHGRL